MNTISGTVVTEPSGRLQWLSTAEASEPVLSGWVEVDHGGTSLYVAFTGRGISLVLTAESVGGRPEGFVEAHRRRFGRAVGPAALLPTGLAEALQTGDSSGLRFDLDGTTAFERDVLTATRSIVRGQTRSYGWVAARIGRPAAGRAVGSALGRNPVPFLIPCHRVVRSDGTSGDYAFGAAMKRSLLQREQMGLDAVLAASSG